MTIKKIQNASTGYGFLWREYVYFIKFDFIHKSHTAANNLRKPT
jgi:hypothetical protein